MSYFKKICHDITPLLFLLLEQTLFKNILIQTYQYHGRISVITLIPLFIQVFLFILYLYMTGEKDILSVKHLNLKRLILALLLIPIVVSLLMGFSYIILKRNLILGSTTYYNKQVTPLFPYLLAIRTILKASCEELVYRAGLMGIFLKDHRYSWIALIISSILFGLSHCIPIQSYFSWWKFCYHCFSGLLFGLIFKRSRTIYLPIIVHAGSNIIFHFLISGIKSVLG